MAEKKVIELEVKTESLKPLKAQLREAQAEVTALAEKFGATSQEAIQAAKKAAELKDAIADAKDLTDAFNPDAKFNALSNSIGGVLNGFQAYEGALGLIGVESEDLQKTLLQVQSAMALSQGIQGALEAKDSFKQLGGVVKDAFGSMTTAGKAFAVTGIGLLLTGVGLLIANFDKLKETFGKVNEGTKALKDTLGEYRQGASDAIKTTTEVGNAFELAKKGVISKEEALHTYNTTLGDTFGKAKNLNEAEDLYNKKTKAFIEATALRAQSQALLGKAAEAQAEALTAGMDVELTTAQNLKAALVMNTQGIEASVKLQKEYLEENTKEAKKNAEEKAKILTDEAKKLLLRAENIENTNKIISSSEKATNDELEAARKEAEAKRKEAADKLKAEKDRQWEEAKDRAEKEKEFTLTEDIEDALRQQLVDSEAAKDEIRKEAIAKQQEDELALMQFKGDLYKQDVDNFDEAEAKKKQLREDNLKSGVQQAKLALDLIASIAESNAGEDESRQKKAFQLRKAANIASATIDGYKAVLSTYADTPGGPVIKGVAAAIAGAFALLQISNIAKSDFKSSATSSTSSSPSGGSSGAGASNVITPNFNIVGNAQATNPLAGLGNQPIQAYVVSGEVTTAQNLDRNRINYATFG